MASNGFTCHRRLLVCLSAAAPRPVILPVGPTSHESPGKCLPAPAIPAWWFAARVPWSGASWPCDGAGDIASAYTQPMGVSTLFRASWGGCFDLSGDPTCQLPARSGHLPNFPCPHRVCYPHRQRAGSSRAGVGTSPLLRAGVSRALMSRLLLGSDALRPAYALLDAPVLPICSPFLLPVPYVLSLPYPMAALRSCASAPYDYLPAPVLMGSENVRKIAQIPTHRLRIRLHLLRARRE